MDWRTIVGGLILVFIVYVIYSGWWPGQSHRNAYGPSQGIYRSEKPFAYWSRVVMMIIVALALLFKIFPENLGR